MKKLIIKILKGDLSLAKTFWLVNILGSIISSIPIILSEIYYQNLNEALSIIILLYLLIYVIYFGFSQIATWRSATKYISEKKKKKQKTFLGYLAKIAVGIFILRAVGTTISSLLI